MAQGYGMTQIPGKGAGVAGMLQGLSGGVQAFVGKQIQKQAESRQAARELARLYMNMAGEVRDPQLKAKLMTQGAKIMKSGEIKDTGWFESTMSEYRKKNPEGFQNIEDMMKQMQPQPGAQSPTAQPGSAQGALAPQQAPPGQGAAGSAQGALAPPGQAAPAARGGIIQGGGGGGGGVGGAQDMKTPPPVPTGKIPEPPRGKDGKIDITDEEFLTSWMRKEINARNYHFAPGAQAAGAPSHAAPEGMMWIGKNWTNNPVTGELQADWEVVDADAAFAHKIAPILAEMDRLKGPAQEEAIRAVNQYSEYYRPGQALPFGEAGKGAFGAQAAARRQQMLANLIEMNQKEIGNLEEEIMMTTDKAEKARKRNQIDALRAQSSRVRDQLERSMEEKEVEKDLGATPDEGPPTDDDEGAGPATPSAAKAFEDIERAKKSTAPGLATAAEATGAGAVEAIETREIRVASIEEMLVELDNGVEEAEDTWRSLVKAHGRNSPQAKRMARWIITTKKFRKEIGTKYGGWKRYGKEAIREGGPLRGLGAEGAAVWGVTPTDRDAGKLDPKEEQALRDWWEKEYRKRMKEGGHAQDWEWDFFIDRGKRALKKAPSAAGRAWDALKEYETGVKGGIKDWVK